MWLILVVAGLIGGPLVFGVMRQRRRWPALRSGDGDFLANVPTSEYKITRYRKSFNLFNPHSIRPYISEPDFRVSLIGENVLNTFTSEIFFNYNSNEESKEIGC